MFIVNPDPFLLPTYRISPFTTESIALNNELPNNDFAVGYFDKKFGVGNWQYTYNGREAIELALEHYQLGKDDLVTILTTSENFYISSCVTKSIEKFCRWNRELVSETKIILINHEFGFPHPGMEKIIATGLPIIEDCCTTFFSQDKKQKVGKYGDFSVYSFPKFFPVQIGGLLVSNTEKKSTTSILDKDQKQYIQNVVSHHLQNEAKLIEKRNQNFEYALSRFSTLGFSARFESDDNILPSALVLNNNSVIGDLNELKVFLSQNGIQSSVFYGEDAFFIPCHQNLSKHDIDYIFEVVKAKLNKPQ
ncbi:MAG TPA: DegT/DnrJ/EryC1/StrS family aminotransferase [Flavobacterium sp.]|uniref:DegT/DnrJ/EryC1/StrS family aminotransferase n=1 Tax=Flavobacterium sp. TaxID=239 RepID=UPI002D1B7928|nr:DegT/DnrJ/EryC1/StrS family aminotransferase [Flavobacterium sp.]HNP33337.1 DegT/DnrJ/EryC1/StrS family aminotransferase [Flavobacterium sp.]